MARASYRKATRTVIEGRCGRGFRGGSWSERLNSNAIAERRFRRATKAACYAALSTL